LVLNIAKQEGIGMAELETIPGTGAEGRLTKKDILSYVSQRGQAPAAAVAAPAIIAAPAAAPAPNPAPAPISINGREEIIEMDRMRKMIGENMVKAKQIAPHVTSFVEADVTNIVKWRDKVKGNFEKKYGTKLTFTPIFMEAIIKAIKDFPMINVSVQGDKIIKKNYINLGMAAALPSGNLIVPVIHDADFLNLPGLAAKVNDLANRARTNKLKPEEIQGGTYTLTNVGSFGNWMGTPIIPQPQVAILAVGAIIKKPAVIETPEGDMIAVRHKMFLSHSYDHLVVDGALGGMFVRRVADYLEQWDVSRDS
jgi:2-oxoglutarate dehydrogenase E2 component (dihydrolipoamide succinyltransferase)